MDEVCHRTFAGETETLKDMIDLNAINLRRFPDDALVDFFRVR